LKRDLDGLRACAKADLHVHAGFGSGALSGPL
jgi:hypothetical protein